MYKLLKRRAKTTGVRASITLTLAVLPLRVKQDVDFAVMTDSSEEKKTRGRPNTGRGGGVNKYFAFFIKKIVYIIVCYSAQA